MGYLCYYTISVLMKPKKTFQIEHAIRILPTWDSTFPFLAFQKVTYVS